MAQREEKAKPRGGRRRQASAPEPRGLTPKQVGGGAPPQAVQALVRAVEGDGGSVLGSYRDPVGGHWQLLVALPVERIQPTPFQRDLSEPHVERLARGIAGLDRFLDPLIVVRQADGIYWTPNGHHRLAALRKLGARAAVALLAPEPELAFQILALNTEKAHNLREKCLEVIRMARALLEVDPAPERDYAAVFEEPAFLTLGLCYEKRARFPGSVYQPVLRRVESFLASKLPRALEEREGRAARLLELEEAVSAAVARLKERGFESPYLKNFVVARINPLRFQRGAKPGLEKTLEGMLAAAQRFDASKVKVDQLARTGGPAGD